VTAAGRLGTALLFLLAAAATAGAEQAREYVVGGGDVLEVNVWKNAELSRQVTVRPDGMITLPLVRDVPAGGLTARQLGESLTERLSAFVNAPNVTVVVTAANSSRVYTYGAVANGAFPLLAPSDALQLLARAGGPATDADLARAFVLRGATRLPVNLEPRSVGERPGEARLALAPGDVLVVPFLDATRGVLVAGEVRSPRGLPFRPGLTVLDAFVEAGGATDYSDLDGVRVLRRSPVGGEGELRVDLSRMIQKGDLADNVLLRPGDIVVVPR